MSKSLKKSFHFLNLLSKIKNEKKRKDLLKEISDDDTIFSALSEIARNQVKGNIKLNKKQSHHLKKHSKTIKGFCCKKIPLNKRRKLIVQSGGFLPILLPLVAGVLGSILNR